MNTTFTENTAMLNYHDPKIVELIKERGWQNLDDYKKIGAVYDYVKDEVLFGYNKSDTLTASQVLNDGIGQCNTKATLLMALLRALNIPCRLHGFEVNKEFQAVAIPRLIHKLAPATIVHTWVEVYYGEQWVALEGVITDKKYLNAVQAMYPEIEGEFSQCAIATKKFSNPEVEWKGTDTFIQKEAITKDFGLFSSPDEFFKKHQQKLSPFKEFLYAHFATKRMTKNVQKIRSSV